MVRCTSGRFGTAARNWRRSRLTVRRGTSRVVLDIKLAFMKLIDIRGKRPVSPHRFLFSGSFRRKLFGALMLTLAIAMLGVWSLERADAQLTILHDLGTAAFQTMAPIRRQPSP